MKKVGIITTFRQSNWGSVLQAYALQKVIERLGYSVELIDYIYPNEYHWKRGLKWGKSKNYTILSFISKWKHNIACSLGIRAWDSMHLMNKFINKNIIVGRQYKNHTLLHTEPPLYDIYVSGSDQIWNPNTIKGDLSYMFDFVPDGSHKISYASSFSCLTIPESLRLDYQKCLSKYSAISVRENNGRKIIKDLIEKDAEVVLDPTLLLRDEEWSKLALKAKKTLLPEKYILCYTLSYTFAVDEPMGALLKKVQGKYNMPVIALNALPKSFDGHEFKLPQAYNKGIPEFLYLIKNASVVVSSSFHGTAFSLNFGKPLVSLAASNEDDRICSVLEMLDLSDHMVLAENISNALIEPNYNVSIEQEKLERIRQQSMAFLKKALQYDKQL